MVRYTRLALAFYAVTWLLQVRGIALVAIFTGSALVAFAHGWLDGAFACAVAVVVRWAAIDFTFRCGSYFLTLYNESLED